MTGVRQASREETRKRALSDRSHTTLPSTVAASVAAYGRPSRINLDLSQPFHSACLMRNSLHEDKCNTVRSDDSASADSLRMVPTTDDSRCLSVLLWLAECGCCGGGRYSAVQAPVPLSLGSATAPKSHDIGARSLERRECTIRASLSHRPSHFLPSQKIISTSLCSRLGDDGNAHARKRIRVVHLVMKTIRPALQREILNAGTLLMLSNNLKTVRFHRFQTSYTSAHISIRVFPSHAIYFQTSFFLGARDFGLKVCLALFSVTRFSVSGTGRSFVSDIRPPNNQAITLATIRFYKSKETHLLCHQRGFILVQLERRGKTGAVSLKLRETETKLHRSCSHLQGMYGSGNFKILYAGMATGLGSECALCGVDS